MIRSTLIVFEVRFQVIWEEKDPQYGKHDKKLYQNQYPQRFSYRHGLEAIAVECNRFLQKGRNSHNV